MRNISASFRDDVSGFAGGQVFLHLRGLTWAFLDTKGAVRVLGPGVVLQLKRGGVVHKRLGALGHARPAVVEIGARLRRKHAAVVSRGRQMSADICGRCSRPQMSLNTERETNWPHRSRAETWDRLRRR